MKHLKQWSEKCTSKILTENCKENMVYYFIDYKKKHYKCNKYVFKQTNKTTYLTLCWSGQSAQGKSIPAYVSEIESLSDRDKVCMYVCVFYSPRFWGLLLECRRQPSHCYQMMRDFPQEKETPSLNKHTHIHTHKSSHTQTVSNTCTHFHAHSIKTLLIHSEK